MKTAFIFASLVALCAPIIRADSVLLSDNFSGSSLDPAKWQTILPFGQSSVIQSGGVVTTTGRGILATAGDVTGPYVINGAFTMNSGLEHFNIGFRTGLQGSDFGERQGMLVSFSNDGDEVSIQRYTSAADWDLLADTHMALLTGSTYFFSIFDNGTDISLAVNGINLLNASSTYSTGDHVAFYSREFGSTSTSIDAVEISHVPDTGSTGLLLGLGIIGLIAIARRK